ncbi:prefoldin subunit alpha [Candidatus Woesearchaeota archaeon]|nr:prefoldin subunit alpha [Candidatus Woesearchaeota archaeon]
MTDEEATAQKYLQFQLLQQQLEELNRHIGMLNEQNAELDLSLSAVNEIQKTKLGNDFLALIANGVFVKGELTENKKLIVNVGSNVTVEKSIPEVMELLQQQKREVSNQLAQVEMLIQELNAQSMKIYAQIKDRAK